MQNKPPFLLAHTRLLTAFFSLLLSALLVVGDDIINADGILYLETASAFLSGGLDAATAVYNWPFYSILIASIHQLTQLPLELSALVVNIALFVLLTDALYLICRNILPSQQHVLIAMLIFLAFYSLNDYRDFIMRDIGYWAFSLLALYAMMSFLDNPNWRLALYWQLNMACAILFRAEGIVLLLALPLFALFHLPRPKIAAYLLLNTFAILGLLAFALSPAMDSLFNGWEKLGLWLGHDSSTIAQRFSEQADQVVQFLPEFIHKHAVLILSSGLIGLTLFLIIEAIHIGYIGLYIIARSKLNTSRFPHQNFLRYAVLLNGLVLLIFISKHYFMISRYCMMTVLLLLLLMAPAITDYIVQAWRNKNKFVLLLFAGVLAVLLQVSFHYSVSKAYIKETAIWASENLASDSRVATNNRFLAYYFNRQAIQSGHQTIKLIQNESYDIHYDQLLLVSKKKHRLSKAAVKEIRKRQQLYHQQNKRGDSASVYGTKNQ